MNSILTKCIAELKNEAPRIDYVLGMLETLSEMQPPLNAQAAPNILGIPMSVDVSTSSPADPTTALETAYATGRIAELG